MDGSITRFGLQDSIGQQVTRTARIMERRIEDDLRPFGLTRIGWCILLAVHDEGKRNPSDIATSVGIDRTATSRALRALEADGLIQREMGREDRRTTEVTLTPQGKVQVMAALPKFQNAVLQFHAKLEIEELETLRHLLQKLGQDAPGLA